MMRLILAVKHQLVYKCKTSKHVFQLCPNEWHAVSQILVCIQIELTQEYFKYIFGINCIHNQSLKTHVANSIWKVSTLEMAFAFNSSILFTHLSNFISCLFPDHSLYCKSSKPTVSACF